MDLIETVAENIARDVISYDARVQAVKVAIRKPHVAVPGVIESLGVEVVRHRA